MAGQASRRTAELKGLRAELVKQLAERTIRRLAQEPDA